jgi:hypothetical protein
MQQKKKSVWIGGSVLYSAARCLITIDFLFFLYVALVFLA